MERVYNISTAAQISRTTEYKGPLSSPNGRKNGGRRKTMPSQITEEARERSNYLPELFS